MTAITKLSFSPAAAKYCMGWGKLPICCGDCRKYPCTCEQHSGQREEEEEHSVSCHKCRQLQCDCGKTCQQIATMCPCCSVCHQRVHVCCKNCRKPELCKEMADHFDNSVKSNIKNCECPRTEHLYRTCQDRESSDEHENCTCCKNCGGSQIGNSCNCCKICGELKDTCPGCRNAYKKVLFLLPTV